ncbi:MAG: hypothetical protein ACJAX7_002055, partial [Saprospiraceae bacterium]
KGLGFQLKEFLVVILGEVKDMTQFRKRMTTSKRASSLVR